MPFIAVLLLAIIAIALVGFWNIMKMILAMAVVAILGFGLVALIISSEKEDPRE